MAPHRLAALPAQKNIEEHVRTQAEFLKHELEPRLAEARAGRRQFYFVDAAHFVLGNFPGWVWAAAAVFIKAAAGRQRYSVLGAWNAAANALLTVVTEATVNAATMSELLEKVARAGYGVPITLALDNAKYQHAAAVKQRAAELHIELLFLPGYSPNLNLIERLWKFTKKKALRAKYHADFASFKAAIDDCLSKLTTQHRPALAQLMTHKFQTFGNVSFQPA